MIVFCDNNIPLFKESLPDSVEVHTFTGREITNQQLVESKCELLFTRSQTKINGDLLRNSNVKLVATATSGTDHADLDYLSSSGIIFRDAKGSNANSVAEYAVYSILKWAYDNQKDINELNVGIIGYGCIGRLLVSYCFALGMNVFVNDPPLFDRDFNFPDYATYTDLTNLIKNCDVISNHVPLCTIGNYPTYYLLNENNLKYVREGALIIHASRGSVIQESALIDLHEKKSIFTVIDVWENEPEYNDKLATLSMIATPHIAGHSYTGKLNGTKMMLNVFKEISGIEPNWDILENELSKSEFKTLSEFRTRKEIMEHLDRCRDIQSDSEIFKKLSNNKMEIRSREFDNYRKNYPVRHESLRTLI
ncbi:MAG: 4-phosphoerythronate dehydrogenase [Candidatus Kapabacteria bacterium]|jgi:erythronate-4-phosphate dehydrogenase|nr:4-phosphoerythronate dehydrogenase [Candidatus Kapabacteria bacterium]